MPSKFNTTGWKPQPHDDRDEIYQPNDILRSNRTKRVDLTDRDDRLEKPYDQRFLSSCVANAVSAALRFGENAKYPVGSHVIYDPSRLWLYWCGRLYDAVGYGVDHEEVRKFLDYLDGDGKEGTFAVKDNRSVTLTPHWKARYAVMEDDGTHERSVIKGLRYFGICPDKQWSYQQVEDHLKIYGDKYEAKYLSQWFRNDKSYYVPKQQYFEAAKIYTDPAFKYFRIKDLSEPNNQSNTELVSHMEVALYEGYPVIVGLRYKSDPGLNRITKDDGWVFEPEEVDDIDQASGHCVLCVGYDQDKRRFTFLNSWADDWGDAGYFYMPYKYFESGTGVFNTSDGAEYPFADDIWVIKTKMRETVEPEPDSDSD